MGFWGATVICNGHPAISHLATCLLGGFYVDRRLLRR